MGKYLKLLVSMLHVLDFSYAISDRVFMYVMIAVFVFSQVLWEPMMKKLENFFTGRMYIVFLLLAISTISLACLNNK